MVCKDCQRNELIDNLNVISQGYIDALKTCKGSGAFDLICDLEEVIETRNKMRTTSKGKPEEKIGVK